MTTALPKGRAVHDEPKLEQAIEALAAQWPVGTVQARLGDAERSRSTSHTTSPACTRDALLPGRCWVQVIKYLRQVRRGGSR
jgi:hypothetical protein